MENRRDVSSRHHPHDRAHRRLERGTREGEGAETDRALSEADKLFDEISNMLTEMRREMLGSGRQKR